MDIYVASRYSNKAQMRVYRAQLEELGHKVTSRWLDFEIDEAERDRIHALRAQGGDEESHSMAEPWAQRDIDDVLRSNCVIWFSPSGRRGGSHVEFGMGLALYIRCIVVGPVENVFHSLPQVERYKDFNALIAQFLTEPENGHFQSSVVLRSARDLL